MIKRFKAKFNNDNLEYEFLSPALEIEETPPSPARRVLIWAILIFTILVFLWSYLSKVDEVAVARGKIIPDGRIKTIQPMETGVIKAIHVREGQKVKKGQLLIELDSTILQADVESSAQALSLYKTDKARLISELNDTDMEGKRGPLFGLQKNLKEARESEYKAREESLKNIISQRENALRAAESVLTKLDKTCRILKEQETAMKKLHENGYLAKMELLDRQKELFATEEEMEAQKKIVMQGRDSLEEAKTNLEALKKERIKGILTDIVDREKSIASMEGEATKAKKRTELERLCSPVDGTVHGLSSYTIGGVVTPAQPIVTIVPKDTPLIIEATALNTDIGFLEVGQEAEIKLDTFSFQKYGTIKGKVVWLSPDSFDDEKLGPVYKMRVEMEKTNIVVDGRDAAINPGMTLSVEVKTGKRRIIEFFLSPIIKYAKESLTLR